jgi:DNA-binding transcriptional LysR family regulator
MDLRRLRLFLAVVDEGGFTRGAEAMFVSQPSVSQAMRELEDELATPLFHRVGRGVVLTAAGEALVGPARQVLRDVEIGEAAVAAVTGLVTGRLDP